MTGTAYDDYVSRNYPNVVAERDSLTAECARLANQVERLKADRRALDIAVTGLRELETTWTADAESAANDIGDGDALVADIIRESVRGISALLNRIGGTR